MVSAKLSDKPWKGWNVARQAATATQQIDNERVRVTEYRFAPGSETGHHVHAFDYVVVPILGGTLTMTDDSGAASQATLVLGQSYNRPAGVSHNVINDTDSEIAFVEIELKG
ncbi:MAG: cupin domain-containing protein [Rhodospirillales bacterium]